MEKLVTFDFPTDQVRLNLCYRDDERLKTIAASSSDAALPKVKAVYDELLFPPHRRIDLML